MKNPFHKKDDGIVILSKPEPLSCGGRYATQDTKAPKQIKSEEMVFFHATSVFNNASEDGGPGYVSAFAAPVAEGTFLFLETGEGFRRFGERKSAFCVTKGSVFPSLVALVRELDLAKENGYHANTAGLPENFGGEVTIRYASGEKISYSDNQSPVLSAEAGKKIAQVFEKAMKGETVPFPAPSDLTAIRFREDRNDGGFTKAVLTVLPDGTGENRKKSRYEDEKVYESVKSVEKETMDAIGSSAANTGIFLWSGLPKNGFESGARKTLTFVFASGKEITVKDDILVPDQIRHGFFDIELELKTKH